MASLGPQALSPDTVSRRSIQGAQGTKADMSCTSTPPPPNPALAQEGTELEKRGPFSHPANHPGLEEGHLLSRSLIPLSSLHTVPTVQPQWPAPETEQGGGPALGWGRGATFRPAVQVAPRQSGPPGPGVALEWTNK